MAEALKGTTKKVYEYIVEADLIPVTSAISRRDG